MQFEQRRYGKELEKGHVEGHGERRGAGLLSIKSLMETMGWTIDQAITALKVSKAERRVYQDLLKEYS